MEEPYVAHIRESDDKKQLLADHLRETAALAERFAAAFQAGPYGHWAGLAHDIGKYSEKGQKRIHGGPKVDHATAGALEAYQARLLLTAFCLAGHHGGLPDGGNLRGDSASDITLSGRLKRQVGVELEDYLAFRQEIELPALPPEPLARERGFSAAFFTRMLYSCLVDADYLNTEAFMRGQLPRGQYDDLQTLNRKLAAHLERFANPSRELNRCRNEILANCLQAGQSPPGLYSLSVPTGAGKTLASLAFALTQACQPAPQPRRIIYVIPYISIIDQTLAVFQDIFGAEQVVAHYSGDRPEAKDDEEDDESKLQQRLATENWDAPLIVTTAVQFFESLFSYKPGKCRKLHNIANSVIIFDEAQMLPLAYLQPCVAAIAELVRRYGVSALLCTATQPALGPFFREYAPELTIREIGGLSESSRQLFQRVRFVDAGPLSDEALAERLAQQQQVLCVVNSRADAQRLFSRLPEEARFHLSTLMTPCHRLAVLDAVRRRLKDELSCRVVSTSLIEAGVDVDFPTVFRAEAGLDSLLQAAGRCNREGKRDPELSLVYYFIAEHSAPQIFHQQIEITRGVLRRCGQVDSPEALHDYFTEIYRLRGEYLDTHDIMKASDKGLEGGILPFRKIGERFKLIDTNTRTIYIPQPESEELCARLRQGERTSKLFRALGAYAVNVYPQHFNLLAGQGALEILADGCALLFNLKLYDQELGLSLQGDEGQALFG